MTDGVVLNKKTETRKYKQEARELNEILNHWDFLIVLPFEGGPQKEYEDLHAPVLKILKQGKSKEELIDYLNKVQVEHFEITPHSRTEEFAERIINWWSGLKNKVVCPTCGRTFSEYLVKFPIFFDDNDETMVYNQCPLCALEGINKANGLSIDTSFKREHSRQQYEKALKEVEEMGQQKKKDPIPKEDIKWEKFTRLTTEEYAKVINKHPELLEEK